MNLEYNLEEHVKGIMQALRGRERVEHLFLEGMRNLTEGAALDREKVEKYVSEKLSDYSPFTRLISSNLQLGFLEATLSGVDFTKPLELEKVGRVKIEQLTQEILNNFQRRMPFSAHLPFSEEHHLEFLLSFNNKGYIFPYTICERCKDTTTHGFPEVFVRRSVLLNIKENEPLFYDNRESPTHFVHSSGKEGLISAYECMRDFVRETRIS